MVEVVAMSAKDVLGREGERATVGYLEGCGFRIPDRHWRSADGEIDIVAVKRHTVVVCDSQTRSRTRPSTQLAGLGEHALWLGVAQ
jgi:putative endonuclease